MPKHICADLNRRIEKKYVEKKKAIEGKIKLLQRSYKKIKAAWQSGNRLNKNSLAVKE
jgi:hypothetical protein